MTQTQHAAAALEEEMINATSFRFIMDSFPRLTPKGWVMPMRKHSSEQASLSADVQVFECHYPAIKGQGYHQGDGQPRDDYKVGHGHLLIGHLQMPGWK